MLKLEKGQDYTFYENGEVIGVGKFCGTTRYGCQMHGDDPKTYYQFNRLKPSGKYGCINQIEARPTVTAERSTQKGAEE